VTGLSFDLTEEQEQLRQAVRDFAEREYPEDVARRLEAAKAPRMSRPAAQAQNA
jgi:alkylation response protein AidB-like acyl-CoA dehydrogenase